MSNSHVITNHISKINCIIIALLPIFVWYKPNASFITGHQYLISHLQDVYFEHVLVFSLVKMVFSKGFYMLIRKICKCIPTLAIYLQLPLALSS